MNRRITADIQGLFQTTHWANTVDALTRSVPVAALGGRLYSYLHFANKEVGPGELSHVPMVPLAYQLGEVTKKLRENPQKVRDL